MDSKLLDEFAKRFGVKWRPQQADAVAVLCDARDSGARCAIVDAPTGAGKSLIATATAWCMLQQGLQSYVLVSDTTLQKQYEDDFARLGLAWPSIMGTKRYECSESGTPVAFGWCSNGLVSLGVKRRDLPCYDSCAYYSARDRARDSPVSLLNYSYWLMQMNYVNLRLRWGGTSQSPAFEKRDAQFFDEAHKVDEIVHRAYAVELNGRLERALATLSEARAADGQAAREAWKLAKSACVERDRTRWLPVLAELELQLESLAQGAIAWRSALDPAVKRWDDATTRAIRAAADLRDVHCKVEDFVDIVKPSPDDVTRARDADGAVFNTLDTFSLVSFMLTRNTKFRVFMSATWGQESLARRAVGARDPIVVRLDSDFDFSHSPLVSVAAGKMSMRKRAESIETVARAIEMIAEGFPTDRGLVHTGSYEIQAQLLERCGAAVKDRATTYASASEKVAAIAAHRAKPASILFGPSLLEGVNLPDDDCRFVAFAKCPYLYLGDEWTKLKSERDPKWYRWKTALAIEQGSGRGIRHASDSCAVFYVDSLFEGFFRRNSDLFSPAFAERVKRRAR